MNFTLDNFRKACILIAVSLTRLPVLGGATAK